MSSLLCIRKKLKKEKNETRQTSINFQFPQKKTLLPNNEKKRTCIHFMKKEEAIDGAQKM